MVVVSGLVMGESVLVSVFGSNFVFTVAAGVVVVSAFVSAVFEGVGC